MKPRILVPFDFSAEAERALDWAADLQRSTGGSLLLLHVVNPLPPGAELAPVPLLASDSDLEELSADLKDKAQKRNIEAAVSVVLSPTIAGAALDAAREHKCDLIVMGTHGRGGLRRLVLGSVAEHVVRHAECPVVTMRAPAAG